MFCVCWQSSIQCSSEKTQFPFSVSPYSAGELYICDVRKSSMRSLLAFSATLLFNIIEIGSCTWKLWQAKSKRDTF